MEEFKVKQVILAGGVSANSYLRSEMKKEMEKRNIKIIIPPRGAVIMAMYGGGTVSNVAYLDCDTTTNQACCNMICHRKEDAASRRHLSQGSGRYDLQLQSHRGQPPDA